MIGGIGYARGRVQERVASTHRGPRGITSGKFLKFQIQNIAFWSVSSTLLQKIILGKQKVAGCDISRIFYSVIYFSQQTFASFCLLYFVVFRLDIGETPMTALLV